MNNEYKNDKILRVLQLYSKLIDGEMVNKAEEAQNYGVNERSIQRDIEDIRCFLDVDFSRTGILNSVNYDRKNNGYRLEKVNDRRLNNSEILAIIKILLDSRAFSKNELSSIIDKLLECCVPDKNRKDVNDLIINELFHYIPTKHSSDILDIIWDLGQAIHESKYIEVSYLRTKDKKVVSRELKPVAIMFSEFYFYLIAFIEDENIRKNFEVLDDAFPTIYRVDRIISLTVHDKKFNIPYSNRFEEGEFRKRVQFMYGGKLQRLKFVYRGPDVDTVLDRLPTAAIINENSGSYTITAEVFGKGIDMWLKSQGNYVENIEYR